VHPPPHCEEQLEPTQAESQPPPQRLVQLAPPSHNSVQAPSQLSRHVAAWQENGQAKDVQASEHVLCEPQSAAQGSLSLGQLKAQVPFAGQVHGQVLQDVVGPPPVFQG
jgi:hypothetical protein